MKCRNYVDSNDDMGKKTKTIVWFNSAGITTLYCSNNVLCSDRMTVRESNANKKYDNYVEKQNAITCSLNQKLSIIKGELWTDINYGIPLFDKYRSKAIMDAYVLQKLNQHSQVKKIISFNSKLVEHAYSCTTVLLTNYGELRLVI